MKKLLYITAGILIFVIIGILGLTWMLENQMAKTVGSFGKAVNELKEISRQNNLKPSLDRPNWMKEDQNFDYKLMDKDAIEFDGLKVTPFKIAGSLKRIKDESMEYTGHVEGNGDYYFLRVVNPEDKAHNILCEVEIIEESSPKKKIVEKGSLIYPNSQTDIMGSDKYIKLLRVKE